jgi:hypothetical protein
MNDSSGRVVDLAPRVRRKADTFGAEDFFALHEGHHVSPRPTDPRAIKDPAEVTCYTCNEPFRFNDNADEKGGQ